jgi:hypothetical protein
MNRQRLKNRLMDFGVASVAVAGGAVVVYSGGRLLGVDLEYYFGPATYTPQWVLTLFFVPFVGGIVVSLIYGLGGKILAHLPALIVHSISYYQVYGTTPDDGSLILPIGYWIFVVILCVEFATIGGVIGEVMVKKTYGRTARHNLHKLHRKYERVAPEPVARGEIAKGSEQ